MKGLKKLSLEGKGKILQKSEMVKILGGGSYVCYESGQLCCIINADSKESCTQICRSYYGPYASCQ